LRREVLAVRLEEGQKSLESRTDTENVGLSLPRTKRQSNYLISEAKLHRESIERKHPGGNQRLQLCARPHLQVDVAGHRDEEERHCPSAVDFESEKRRASSERRGGQVEGGR